MIEEPEVDPFSFDGIPSVGIPPDRDAVGVLRAAPERWLTDSTVPPCAELRELAVRLALHDEPSSRGDPIRWWLDARPSRLLGGYRRPIVAWELLVDIAWLYGRTENLPFTLELVGLALACVGGRTPGRADADTTEFTSVQQDASVEITGDPASSVATIRDWHAVLEHSHLHHFVGGEAPSLDRAGPTRTHVLPDRST